MQHILSIPLKQGYEDTISWQFDQKGCFSVKSAYHILDDNRQLEKVKQSGSSRSAAATKDKNFGGSCERSSAYQR